MRFSTGERKRKDPYVDYRVFGIFQAPFVCVYLVKKGGGRVSRDYFALGYFLFSGAIRVGIEP